VYLSKREALETLSNVLGVPINHVDPANAVLNLDGGVVLSIEVPKFGEDLPLTIDLSSDDESPLERATKDVIEATKNDLSWSATIVGQSLEPEDSS